MDTELHFLVVSDEQNLRSLIVSLLKEIGFVRVSEAENGEMALRTLNTTKYIGAPIEFIITDFVMPLMDGLNLIRSLRGDPELNHLPILMCSSHASKKNILDAANAGADDYIVRPINALSLLKKLEKMLAKLHIVTIDFPRVWPQNRMRT
ncbi:response regulator [Undibacterium sp. Dicai25W]|uniref:response regulator n=1 Tax=Undibacterium sp. Dicai25W TaxID=3413034 RepID=UPI003BF3F8A0